MYRKPMDKASPEELLDRKRLNRRRFIRRCARGSLAAAVSSRLVPGLTEPAFAVLHPHRVVRVHSASATSWPGPWPVPPSGPPYYYDFIETDVVKLMFNKGIQRLTDAASPAAAWQEIMTAYQPGDKVVIKVNLNNSSGPDDLDNVMDATAPVVDEVLDGLTQSLGIPVGDVLVYDTSRYMLTARLVNRSRYAASVFSTNRNVWDESAEVTFRDPPEAPDLHYNLSLDLTTAQHLINIPILKRHAMGITGAMKNHYGSVKYPSYLHADMENNSYIGDVNNNPHIRDKTRLIVCDALFGNWSVNYGEGPRDWTTFPEGTPNSLLFSLDPVAMDSVLYDIIRDERVARGTTAWDPHEFLQVAMDYHGLGVHEHKPYSEIDYVETGVEVGRSDIDNMIRLRKSGEATDDDVLDLIDRYMSGE